MKLLFDQNLSPKLPVRLADLFPGSNHVFPLGLGSVLDTEVWDYAEREGYSVVTKDADFSDLCTLLGFPPNVVWIRRGNCKTEEVEALLRGQVDAIIVQDADASRLRDAFRRDSVPFTKLASTGGFLRRGLCTFVSGVADNRVDPVKRIIEQNSKKRSAPPPTPARSHAELQSVAGLCGYTRLQHERFSR